MRTEGSNLGLGIERVEQIERIERRVWASRAVDKLTGGNTAAFFFAWLICGAVLAVCLVIFWTSFNPGRPFELRLGLEPPFFSA